MTLYCMSACASDLIFLTLVCYQMFMLPTTLSAPGCLSLRGTTSSHEHSIPTIYTMTELSVTHTVYFIVTAAKNVQYSLLL